MLSPPRSPVPPSKPVAHVPTSATIGSRIVLRCTETDGSPPPSFRWYKDGMLLPTDPKSSPSFRNSSYSLDTATGELVSGGGLRTRGSHPWVPASRVHIPAPIQVFQPLGSSDSGDYSCEASNNVGSPQRSDAIHMEASKDQQQVWGGTITPLLLMVSNEC